jgi:hypothetical protein
MTFAAIVDEAGRDPAHADLSKFNNYADGSALTAFVNAIRGLRHDGLAYRGNPPDPKLKVVAVSSGTVALSSCPQDAPVDPEVEFYVTTGKQVSPTKRTPPPPYLRALTMRLLGGHWKLTTIAIDSSRTCKP